MTDLIPKEVELNFARRRAFDNNKRGNSYSIFISCFNNDFKESIILTETEYLDNAKAIKDELIKKYKYSEGGNTIQFQQMLIENRVQAKGPYFLILVRTLNILL